MKNTVTETFNIDVPIFAFSHCRDVVAAVSKAGGFGVLGAVGHSPDALEIDLKWIEDEIGEHPYGVDLIVPAKYEGSDEGGLTVHKIVDMIPDAHHEYVTEILEKYDVPELAETKSGQFSMKNDGAAPMSAGTAGPQLEIALAHNPSLVVNALGPPPQFMIDQVKEAGRKVGALAGKAQHAERHVNAGVDLSLIHISEPTRPY